MDEGERGTRSSYGDRLASAMRGASIDAAMLAQHLKISVNAVKQVLSGSSKAFSAANNARAAVFLSVRALWLSTGEGERLAHNQATPEPDAMALTPEERDVILALRVLHAPEREALIASLLERAQAHVDQLTAAINRQHERQQTPVIPLRKT